MNEFPYPNQNDRLPYDPKDVDIRQQVFSVRVIADMIRFGDIALYRENDFQRLSGIWTIQEKSRLIESMIMRIPLPIIYLDGSSQPWKIVDGLQRLSTIHAFINLNEFKLQGLEYLAELNDCDYENLPFSYKRSIQNSELSAFIVNPGTPFSVIVNIFQRINMAGKKLYPQELRNGFFPADQ